MKTKRVIDAFIKTVFSAGCIHLIVLTFAALSRGKYEELNFFNFMSLQYFFPWITQGILMFVASQGVFFGMFLIVYSILKRKNK
jgi:hypothetical protein